MAYSPETDYPQPQSSFEFPVPVPLVDPLDGTMVEVQFPEEYAPLILGCLLQLLQETTWDTTDPTELGTAITRCNELIYLFQERTLITPPGSVMVWTNNTAPNGWLFCDGSEISRTTYADLFANIGTGYGVGDGTTTFTLPDWRGRVPVGSGTGPGLSTRNIGDYGGEEDHLLTNPEMATHTHIQDAHTHTENPHTHVLTPHTHAYTPPLLAVTAAPLAVPTAAIPNPVPSLTSAASDGIADATATINDTTATNQNEGLDVAHNNMQPFLVGMWIIKA